MRSDDNEVVKSNLQCRIASPRPPQSFLNERPKRQYRILRTHLRSNVLWRLPNCLHYLRCGIHKVFDEIDLPVCLSLQGGNRGHHTSFRTWALLWVSLNKAICSPGVLPLLYGQWLGWNVDRCRTWVQMTYAILVNVSPGSGRCSASR